MEAVSPVRRDPSMQRHDGDSPVISMKRLMQQLKDELEALRQQQDILLKQVLDQRKQDEDHRTWVQQRFETLDRTVRDAAVAASALGASAAASPNAAAAAAAANVPSATAAAPAAPWSGRLSPAAASAAAVPLLHKTASFEFSCHDTRLPKEGGSSGGGSGSFTVGFGGAGASPLGGGGGNSGGGSGQLGASGGGLHRRFRMPSPSSSDLDVGDADLADDPSMDAAGGAASRSAMSPSARARRNRTRSRRVVPEEGEEGEEEQQQEEEGGGEEEGRGVAALSSAFAAAGAQDRALRQLVGSGGRGSGSDDDDDDDGAVAADSGGGARRAEATLRRGDSMARRQQQQHQQHQQQHRQHQQHQRDLLKAGGSLQEDMPSLALPEGMPSLDSSGGAAGGPTLLHWSSHGHSSAAQSTSLSYSHSMGHGHHHHHHHSHGPGGHSAHGHGQGHPFFPSTRGSHHGASGFGSVATLFPAPSSRRNSTAEDMPPLPVPSSPPRLLSLREMPGSGSSTPFGGGGPSALDLSRISFSAGGLGGGGGAPSLARDSVRSASATEQGTDLAETASIKHFKGIPSRLVEIYRQRAEQSHWSLQGDATNPSRGASRLGSCDMMARPMGLARQSAAPTAGQSRLAMLHSGGSSKSYDGPYKDGGRDSVYDEASAFAILDPNYDHPRMIGDDDEYDRPLTLVERLQLYTVGLIRPEGRTKWDLFILLLLVWVLFASPVIICFGLSGDVINGDWVGIVELSVDFAFALDIYLNFRTAYYDSKGHLVTERWRIARHYFKTWFLLDVICVIPYDLITAGTMGFLSMLKLLRVNRVGKVIRMIKMYRLLRVIRLPRLVERLEMFIDRGVLQVIAFILSVCLLAHLSACIFFYMAYLDDLGPQTWVAAYGVQDADLATKYLTSLYWAFTTTATVGYGDITPKTDKEKILAIFVMCMGVSLVGYVTSSITNIMGIKNAQQTNIAVKKQLVMDVLKARSVPSELSRRVYNFFDYVSSKMIKREEADLLAELPFKLRSRMLYAVYSDMLSRIPSISRLPPHVLIELVSQLKPHYFVEGDIVAMQGDYIDALYIVSEGLLEVRTYMFPADVEPWRIFEAVHKDELRHMPYSTEGRLKPRCFFGQAGVLQAGVWPATVIARNCCELYALDREGLLHMMALQPELQDMLGVPRSPVAASVAHAASLVGPGANPLLPPTDRNVLHADFPVMDAAPQRGLMQNMLRSMGHMITGGLARASASHYPHMPGGTGSGGTAGWTGGVGGPGPAAAAAGGGGARAMLRSGLSMMGFGRSEDGASGGRDGGSGGGGCSDIPGDSTFSRFRPFGGKPARPSVQLPETSRLLNGGDRSDANGAAGGLRV